MKVKINGKNRNIDAGMTLEDLLQDLDITPETVVVELNGRIVKGNSFASELVQADAVIEILRFVGGG